MNLDQVLSLVRAVLNVAGGTIIAKGYADSSNWEAIAGGVLAVVAVVWAFLHHQTPPAPTPPTAPKP